MAFYKASNTRSLERDTRKKTSIGNSPNTKTKKGRKKKSRGQGSFVNN